MFGAGTVVRAHEFVSGRTLARHDARCRAIAGIASRVLDALDDSLLFDAAQPNPTLDAVDAAVAELRDQGIEAVIGLGGGSAIDLAKVLSLALAVDDFEVRRMLDPGHPWTAVAPLPMVAVPTTAGTGSEVTPFATLWDSGSQRKVSVETPHLHPTAAVVDPDLATTLPWEVTLSTGLDAFCQCVESILNRRANAGDECAGCPRYRARAARLAISRDRVDSRVATRHGRGGAPIRPGDQSDADRTGALDVVPDHGSSRPGARARVCHEPAGRRGVQRRALPRRQSSRSPRPSVGGGRRRGQGDPRPVRRPERRRPDPRAGAIDRSCPTPGGRDGHARSGGQQPPPSGAGDIDRILDDTEAWLEESQAA